MRPVNLSNLSAVVLGVCLSGESCPAEQRLPVGWERCVVMLERSVPLDDGTVRYDPHGTGFLMWEATLGHLLITCKHLLNNRDSIFLRFYKSTAANGTGKSSAGLYREAYGLIGVDSLPLWKSHADSSVDVAVLQLRRPSAEVDATVMKPSRLLSFDSLYTGSDVFFFGFTWGVKSESRARDVPILRSGIVSFKVEGPTRLTPAVLLNPGTFLVDGFSFGGNSGSPVLTPISKTASRIAGILTSHVPSDDELIVPARSGVAVYGNDTVSIQIPADTVYYSENSGLAIAVCADRIREILEVMR